MPSNAGLFYFDASYRPVPLEMQFVGVSERNVLARLGIMDEVCYQKVGWERHSQLQWVCW